MTKRKQILLTNDDGIQSPGLWAAAEALSNLGYVTIVAPREQASASGRSLPITSDGKISKEILRIGNQKWETYSIGGTPAQAVLHSLLEIVPDKPDLVVSGINYGENVGHCITISGTVMAALEAASMGIKGLAVSLQMHEDNHRSYSTEIDFSTSAYFTYKFADIILKEELPEDVDALKIDVPQNANPQTEWRMTRLARHRYYIPVLQREGDWSSRGHVYYALDTQPKNLEEDTDLFTLIYEQKVSVTPISLDMTSRTDILCLEDRFRKHE